MSYKLQLFFTILIKILVHDHSIPEHHNGAHGDFQSKSEY